MSTPPGHLPPASRGSVQDADLAEFTDVSSATNGVVSPSTSQAATHSVNFLSVLLYKFFDWVRGKFGKAMTAKQVGSHLDAAFPERAGWSRKEISVQSPLSDQGGEALYLDKKTLNYREHRDNDGRILIVADPCHDMPVGTPMIEHMSASDFSVAECLTGICKSHPDGTVNVQIPVLQACSFHGGMRGHFALLSVTIEEGFLTAAALVDSKGGLVDTFYDGAAHLLTQLRDTQNLSLAYPDDFAITTTYLGDQSLFNDTDCGRFAIAHAQHFANDGAYHAIGQEDFLAWCRDIENSVIPD